VETQVDSISMVSVAPASLILLLQPAVIDQFPGFAVEIVRKRLPEETLDEKGTKAKMDSTSSLTSESLILLLSPGFAIEKIRELLPGKPLDEKWVKAEIESIPVAIASLTFHVKIPVFKFAHIPPRNSADPVVLVQQMAVPKLLLPEVPMKKETKVGMDYLLSESQHPESHFRHESANCTHAIRETPGFD
jgi:hypothetical protein